MTTIEDFIDTAIHTDVSAVIGLRDRTTSEFVAKMAAAKATVEFEFDATLRLWAKTPFGRYEFVVDADGSGLVVDQVL